MQKNFNRFKDWFRHYFYYTQTERKGIFILLTALGILIMIPQFLYLFYRDTPTDFGSFKDEIAGFEASLTEEETDENGSLTASSNGRSAPESFSFDPNTASEADFVKLGLSPKTAGTIVKYRSKGGKFRTPDDFGKIYSIKPDDLARLKPLINIASHANPQKFYDKKDSDGSKTSLKAESFAFDPNTASEQDLARLGLSAKTIASITNYRSKGGKFKTAADFQKIYTLSPQDFERLAPLINIPPPASLPKPIASNAAVQPMLSPNTNAAFTSKRKNTTVKIDINTALVEDWEQLRGIGIGFANRINSYREKLGGFHKIEQVKEVYGLHDSIYQRIAPQLIVGSGLRKININAAAAAELKNHPYLGWKYANLIVSYREQNGKYKQVSDLKKIAVMTDEVYNKIQMYMTTD